MFLTAATLRPIIVIFFSQGEICVCVFFVKYVCEMSAVIQLSCNSISRISRLFVRQRRRITLNINMTNFPIPHPSPRLIPSPRAGSNICCAALALNN